LVDSEEESAGAEGSDEGIDLSARDEEAVDETEAAPSRTQSADANGQARPCCVCRPLARTWDMPRIEATDRSKLLEASGIITASAISALIERLLTIDWKVKAVRKVSPFRIEKTTMRRTSRIARFHTEKKCVALALIPCRPADETLMPTSLGSCSHRRRKQARSDARETALHAAARQQRDRDRR
jgi:hypothetical protein